MDIGNLFEKLEKDSRLIFTTGALCFPIAFVDCWKLSPAFRDYDLIPQIIISIGIGMLLTMGGILCNLISILIMDPTEDLSSFISLLPIACTSIVVILGNNLTPIDFELYFVTWCLISFLISFISKKTTKRDKKKSSDIHDND